MEMALDPAMPTYSGGLGVLAGDTLRAAADAGLRMVAVTLLYNDGFFTQVLDEQGTQLERPVNWDPEKFVERVDETVAIEIEGRDSPHRRVALHGEGCSGPRGLRVHARHRPAREHGRGPQDHLAALRRRRALPPAAGDGPGSRRHRHAARAGLRQYRDVPHERGALRAHRVLAVRGRDEDRTRTATSRS